MILKSLITIYLVSVSLIYHKLHSGLELKNGIKSGKQSQAHQTEDVNGHVYARASQTPEQACRYLDANRQVSLRLSETLEHSQARRLLDAERHASHRTTDTLNKVTHFKRGCVSV